MTDFSMGQSQKYDMEQYQKYDTEFCNLQFNTLIPLLHGCHLMALCRSRQGIVCLRTDDRGRQYRAQFWGRDEDHSRCPCGVPDARNLVLLPHDLGSAEYENAVRPAHRFLEGIDEDLGDWRQ